MFFFKHSIVIVPNALYRIMQKCSMVMFKWWQNHCCIDCKGALKKHLLKRCALNVTYVQLFYEHCFWLNLQLQPMCQSINDHHNIVSLDLFSVLKDKEEWFFGRFVQQLHYLRKRQWLGGGYNSKGNSTGAQNFNFEKFLLIVNDKSWLFSVLPFN